MDIIHTIHHIDTIDYIHKIHKYIIHPNMHPNTFKQTITHYKIHIAHRHLRIHIKRSVVIQNQYYKTTHNAKTKLQLFWYITHNNNF